MFSFFSQCFFCTVFFYTLIVITGTPPELIRGSSLASSSSILEPARAGSYLTLGNFWSIHTKPTPAEANTIQPRLTSKTWPPTPNKVETEKLWNVFKSIFLWIVLFCADKNFCIFSNGILSLFLYDLRRMCELICNFWQWWFS